MKLFQLLTLMSIITSVETGFRHPVVQTGLGKVLGQRKMFSTRFFEDPVEVQYYLGIRYAQPPINMMRFRPAEPADPFEDTYYATDVPPSCVQEHTDYMDYLTAESGYSEDCLYLNIFAPTTAPPNASVIVWIHGGLFEWGSGSDFPYNPFIMAAVGNVIVVTFNYRLNIFGMLTTGDTEIPQYAALTDQQQALKWVHENIAAFGGDPSSVTIFGEDSGAVSVGWHLLSSISKQYFKRVIIQGENPLQFLVNPVSTEMAFQNIQKMAYLADCKPAIPENTALIRDCLASKAVDELLDLKNQLQLDYPDERLWGPVADDEVLFKSIPDLLEDGFFTDIDFLLGTTEDDGTFLAYSLFDFPTEKPFVNETVFSLMASGTNDSIIADLLQAMYSNGIDHQDGNYFDALADAVADARSTCPMTNLATELQEAGASVYMYHLIEEPLRSIWNFSTKKVIHFDDLRFLSSVPSQGHLFSEPSRDATNVFLHVMQMWTNFAKLGDPSVLIPLPENLSKSPKFSSDSKENQEFDLNFSNKSTLLRHYCMFWNNELPQLLRLQDITAASR